MKKNKPFGELFYRSLKKKLIIMRNAIILLILGVLQAHAIDSYSQNTRLSLNFSETELVNVLDKIEQESEFFFLYNEKLLETDRKVSIAANDELISPILDNLFDGTDVRYTIIDRKIILAPDYLTSEPQQKQITGTVTDKNGPIPGANVIVTGSTIGTITDLNGKYSITLPPGAQSLTFTFIGMEPQEISIGTLTQIDVTMAESAIGLNEVIVIGYGTTRRGDLTGSVSSINTNDLVAVPSTNTITSITGRLSGLVVRQNSGRPGDDIPNFSIRGFGTPLVIVDGTQRDFTQLDPNEIESISILKDESAAMYGARAGNGVILVTTRRGKIGAPKISFNSSLSNSRNTFYPEPVNAYQYATMLTYAEGGVSSTSTFSQEDIDKYLIGTEPGYVSTNWKDLTMRDWTPQQ